MKNHKRVCVRPSCSWIYGDFILELFNIMSRILLIARLSRFPPKGFIRVEVYQAADTVAAEVY